MARNASRQPFATPFLNFSTRVARRPRRRSKSSGFAWAGADGALEAVAADSTRAGALTATPAGIVKVKRYNNLPKHVDPSLANWDRL